MKWVLIVTIIAWGGQGSGGNHIQIYTVGKYSTEQECTEEGNKFVKSMGGSSYYKEVRYHCARIKVE